MKSLWNHPLGRELVVILAVKIALILALWWAFFSGPVTPTLTAEGVRRAFFEQQTVSAHTVRSNP